MTEEAFEAVKGREPYQVFLCTTHVGFPLSFAVHPWFVTVVNGEAHRYELVFLLDKKDLRFQENSYVYKDFLKPWQGFPVFFQHEKAPHFKSNIIHILEGGEGSSAEAFVRHIHEKYRMYPYQQVFSYYPGPNSNTYVQWLIDTGPENDFTLPWNAFGKGFEVHQIEQKSKSV